MPTVSSTASATGRAIEGGPVYIRVGRRPFATHAWGRDALDSLLGSNATYLSAHVSLLHGGTQADDGYRDSVSAAAAEASSSKVVRDTLIPSVAAAILRRR